MNSYLKPIVALASECKHVKVNTAKLAEFAALSKREDIQIPDHRGPVFPEADDDTFVQFIGVANAINFCFRDPVTKDLYEMERDGKKWRGSYGMFMALKHMLDIGAPIFDPKYLSEIAPEDVDLIFGSNPPIPLAHERLMCLRSAGMSLLDAGFDGYADLFRACKYRAFDGGNGIVETLVAMDPCFYDAETWAPNVSGSVSLQFHKRANLLVMMYHGRALASGGKLPLIEDVDDLTPPTDYHVPRVLRYKGIHEYSEHLAQMVDSGEEVRAGSREEIEIRIQTASTMRRLCVLTGKPIAAMDFKVWSHHGFKQQQHITTTTAY